MSKLEQLRDTVHARKLFEDFFPVRCAEPGCGEILTTLVHQWRHREEHNSPPPEVLISSPEEWKLQRVTL
jgi:hypothetical protein